jgi:hypothetical protein
LETKKHSSEDDGTKSPKRLSSVQGNSAKTRVEVLTCKGFLLIAPLEKHWATADAGRPEKQAILCPMTEKTDAAV